MPAGGLWPGITQRHHVAVVDVRVAPDFQVELRKIHRLVVGDTDHVDMRKLHHVAAQIDRVGRQRIMIARQENDRPTGVREQLGAALQDPVGLAIIVENIADQQNDVGVMSFRRLQHHPQARCAILPVGALMGVVVDMQIGTVHEYDIIHDEDPVVVAVG